MSIGQRQILGLRFFLGTAAEAVARAESGGLVVVPAAPALKEIATDARYREALLRADTLLPDSAFMVLVWNRLQRDDIRRVSGLAYLRELLKLPSMRRTGNTLWVLPSAASVRRTAQWLGAQGFDVPDSHLYAAPSYSAAADDEPMDAELVALLQRLRPQHVVIGVGGGTQEPLGADLKGRLGYLPAIHCVGAAIGFLTGEQATVPVWADRVYLGWLLRTLREPRRFGRRYWEARRLYTLLRRYRERMPPLA